MSTDILRIPDPIDSARDWLAAAERAGRRGVRTRDELSIPEQTAIAQTYALVAIYYALSSSAQAAWERM